MSITEKTDMLLYVKAEANEPSGMQYYLIHPTHQWYMGDESVKVKKIQIEYEQPDTLDEEQLRAAAIQTLREKQDRVIAEAQLTKVKLQEKIDQLMLITHQPGTSMQVGKIVDDKMSPNMCKPHLGATSDEDDFVPF